MTPWTASANRGSPADVYITARHAHPPADEKPWLTMIRHPSSTGAHSTQSEQCLERILCRVYSASYMYKTIILESKVLVTWLLLLWMKVWVVTKFLNSPIFMQMYGVDQPCSLLYMYVKHWAFWQSGKLTANFKSKLFVIIPETQLNCL